MLQDMVGIENFGRQSLVTACQVSVIKGQTISTGYTEGPGIAQRLQLWTFSTNSQSLV